jgi:predicted alpha/beta-hydrolase family hydrolase
MNPSASAAWDVDVGGEVTAAAWDPPARAGGPVFVCAHGAGGHMSDRSILAVARELTARGIGVVRFNFLYRARRSARPDPMPRLLACFDAVLARVRDELSRDILLIGGRSMGGRAASVLVSSRDACDGLILLAYPLHPPGQPQKLRSDHLPRIKVPVLCINGTRDAFCGRPLMEGVLSGLGPNWQMHWVGGADHGFHVLKSSGRTDPDVLTEIGDATSRWVSHHRFMKE